MKNKLFFKIIRFIKKLGLTADDITLDTEDTEGMTSLATKIFGALLNLTELEQEYYDITIQLYDCTQEEAEDKEIIEVLMKVVTSFKANSNFSIGVLKTKK